MYHYRGVKDGKPSHETLTVMHRTAIVGGAPCVVVDDRMWVSGYLEERTTVVEDIALTALAAAGDWPGAGEAVEKLAKELGTSADDVSREIRKRQAPA